MYFFYLIEQHFKFLLHTLEMIYMCTLCDSTNINTIIKFVPHASGDGFYGGSDSYLQFWDTHIHPVSWNCAYHLRMELSDGGCFLNLVWIFHWTVVPQQSFWITLYMCSAPYGFFFLLVPWFHLLLLLLFVITFLSVHKHIPETNHVSRVYSVAAILRLQYTVCVILFPMICVLYFYISTIQSMCAVPSMTVFYSSLMSCFPSMLFTLFLNDFKMVQIAPNITNIFCSYFSHTLYFYGKVFTLSNLFIFFLDHISISETAMCIQRDIIISFSQCPVDCWRRFWQFPLADSTISLIRLP